MTTTYIGNYFEWTGSTSTMKKYYYAGSTRVVMRTGSSTINYLLGDHLGSQAITTNSSGVESAEIRYHPWGTARYTSGTTPTTYQFTGQRVESGLGLYFYNARWYDPSLARFVSADTVVPDPGISQAYDRYAYTYNNPIKYIDPSGHRTCTDERAATGDETCEQNYPENEPNYIIHIALLGTHQIPKIGSDITAPEKTVPSIVNYLLTVIGNAILALSNEQSNKIDIYSWLTWNEYNDGNISIQGITINNYSIDTTIYFQQVDISASKYRFTNTPNGILGQNQEVIKYAISPINSEYLYTSYPGSTQYVSLNTKEPICEFPIIDSALSVNLTALILISTGKLDNRTIINSSYTYSIPPR